MLELDDALNRILAALPQPETETAPLDQCAGRILAETLKTPIDLPPFDNSAMDGYALRASDVTRASSDHAARLRVVGKIPAGATFDGEVTTGTCVRLFTGSPLPCGADAVVMQEDTRPDAPDHVLVLDRVKPWENVRLRGEDVRAGTVIGQASEPITPAKLNLIAATGTGKLTVGKRPVVAVLATGSELREAGAPLQPGQIYESNRAALAALIARAGGTPHVYPLAPDSADETRAALQRAFSECDLVITCGGVSVGEFDLVKDSFARLGGTLEFWKVAIRPGKPFVFGQLEKKFLFGLPGNPVSAFVTFLLLVWPALRRWQGAAEVRLPAHPGRLVEALNNTGDRRHFVRAIVDRDGNVRPAGAQASHMLGSLAAANGLVDVPPKTTLQAGASVTVLRWD